MERREGRKRTGWIKNVRAERNLKFVWEKQVLEVWDWLVLVSSLSTTQQAPLKKKQVMSPETAAKQNLLLELKPLRVSVAMFCPMHAIISGHRSTMHSKHIVQPAYPLWSHNA